MKKSIVIVLLAVLSVMATAQITADKPAPAPEKEINLKLTVTEVQLVLDRLQEGKYSEVGPIINKIVLQARPQLDSTNQKK